MVCHIDGFGEAFGFSVKSGEIVADETIFRFDKTGFCLAYNMLFCNTELLIGKAIVARRNVNIIALLQPKRHRQPVRKRTRFGHRKVNNAISDSMNSKPYIDLSRFF